MICSLYMKPVIQSLTLQGFRSIAAETVELDNPTFLVGRNGSGKSNIVDAFRLLGEAMESPLRAAIARRGGISELLHRVPGSAQTSRLGIGIGFSRINGDVERAHYAFQVKAQPPHGFLVDREQCSVAGRMPARFERQGGLSLPGLGGVVPHTEPDALLLPIAGGLQPYAPLVRVLSGVRAYSIDPATLRGNSAPDDGLSLLQDGSNAASVIRAVQQRSQGDFEAICELLSATLPYPVRVRPVQRGPGLSLEFQQGGAETVTFDSSSMSEGTLHLLGMLLVLFQSSTPSLILLEEPEAWVHPGALGVVLDILQAAAGRTQVIVTTHSPEVLDAKWIEDRHVRIVSWEAGGTRVRRLSEGSRRVLREHLGSVGELLRSDALDSAPEHEAGSEAVDLFQTAG